jgi:hypothetical protein
MIGTSTDTGTATVGGVSKTFTLDKYVEEGDTAAPKLDEVTGLTSPNQRNVVHAYTQSDNPSTSGVDESLIRGIAINTLPSNTRASIDWDGDFKTLNVYENPVHGDINDFDLGGNADTTPSQKVKSFDQWYNARFNFKDLASAMDGFWAPPRNYPLEVGETKQDVMEGTVAALGFAGLAQPINRDGTSVFKLGSSVPVKLVLTDAAGNPITPNTSPNTQVIFSAERVSTSIEGTQLEGTTSVTPTSGNLFKFDTASGQWVYNWGTKGLAQGTWYIRVYQDDDGTAGSLQPSLLTPPLAGHNDPSTGPFTEKLSTKK